mgnify:CR=1 FL=1
MSHKTLIVGGYGYIGTALAKEMPCRVVGRHDKYDESKYDTIILLAGHSSVAMCQNDPEGAWDDNVTWFTEILGRLRDDQRLIYASSGSVYNRIADSVDESCNQFNCGGMYDLTKHTIDNLALLSGKHTYGLRFATVNGFSDVLRVDVMMNKMVNDVKENGHIHIANKDLSRPILGIHDLCRAVKTIVESKEDKRGIYNLASFSATVGDMANEVVKRFGGEVIELPDTPHYVFNINTDKFEKAYKFKFNDTVDTILTSLEREPDTTVVRV